MYIYILYSRSLLFFLTLTLLILDYAVYNNCEDQAYGPDCLEQFNQGQCTANLSSSQNVQTYCKKTCGLCSASNSTLKCNSGLTCNGGSCQTQLYFGVSSVKCTCPQNLAGAYCERRNKSKRGMDKLAF